MAIEKVIDIKIQGNADEAVGSLRSQLRAAQADVAELSAKFGATSQQAVEAAKRAGQLKDQIGDAKALTDAFNPDAKFKALSSSLAGVAGGFAAVQGGMALFGAESAEVEKTLLKVQSAMALSQGLQAIGESVDSFKQLSAVIQSTTTFKKLDTLATAAATVAQRLFSSAVTTTAVSFNALKTAIVSTGIGALVVGLGYLVAKMNESSDATEELTDKQKGLNRQLEYGKELADFNAKGIDYNTQIELAAAKQRGASDKELTQIKLDGVNARRNANYEEIKSIAATQKEGYNLTKEQNKRIQELTAENLDLERKGRLEIANFNAEQAEKEREAEKKSGEEKTANTEKNKKEEAAALKAIADKKLADDMKSAQDAINILNTLSQNNETPAEKAEREYKDRKAVLEANNLSTEELTRQHLKNLANIELDIAAKKIEKEDSEFLRLQELTLEKDDYDKLVLTQKYESEYLAAEGNAELQKQLKIKLDKDIIAVDVATAATQDEIEKKKQQARQVALSAYSSSLKTAASLLGESTDAGKAAAIAATTIDTIQSGVSAFKGMVSAVPGPVGIALGAVAAAGALASGYASVKKILAVKTPKGGGGGGGGAAPTMSGGGAAGGAAPQFNVVGNSGVNQLAGIMATNENAPVKTYVVAQDVTSGQSLDRNIIRNASLG
jgi:hypothetical protein